jgi:alcohol dehydrogenase class IV
MYYNPVEVFETSNWSDKCKNFQENFGLNKPLVITSKGNLHRHNLSSLFEPDSIFSDIKPDPTFVSCQRAIDFIDISKFNCVIAIGGGSVMDTAKVAMACIGTGINQVSELLTITKPFDNAVPSVFIPTTHGTGSEVTMWGTIWNMDEKKKYSISHPDLYPNIAILDEGLTSSLPLDLSIITVMDALSHSFESIWNKNANPTSTSYAVEAITLIIKNIEKFKKNPNDLKIRKKLLIASNKAGLAFSNTKTAAAHSISYPLTVHYGIPHGIASSISLIPLLNMSKVLIMDSLKKICYNTDLTFEELIKSISLIPQNLLFSLKGWKVPIDCLSLLAKESFTKGRMDNYLIELTKHKVKGILEKVYN